MIIVDTSEDSLRIITLGVGVAEVESEDLLVEEPLVDHVVKWWDALVDGDSVESETEDTVEATEGESQPWLLGSLSEVLTFDLQIADGEVVVGDETLHAAGAVVDLERGSVGLVSVGLGGVILGVKIAGDGATLLGRNPEVGGAGIENDLEGLRWVAEGDLGEV